MKHNLGTYASMDAIGKRTRHQRFEQGTWLQSEETAYPNGGQTRMGRAMIEGKPYRVWAGIPDTYWTIPAHAKVRGKYVAGWLSVDDGGTLRFRAKVNA